MAFADVLLTESDSDVVFVDLHEKTGGHWNDACLWLLAHDVDPDDITWIMPRDSWLLDRARFQDGGPGTGLGFTVEQLEQSAVSTSLPDLYARLAAAGHLLRLDPEVEPTKFCCATVTVPELAELRRITNVVRLGRVQRVEHDRITLDDGEVPAVPGWLYVDCSASAFRDRQLPLIFEGDVVMPQAVQWCLMTFSAALVALVELEFEGDDVKNSLCQVVALPQVPSDWARMQVGTFANAMAWAHEPVIRSWLAASRLNQLPTSETPEDAELLASLQGRFRDVAGPSVANLTRLLESA